MAVKTSEKNKLLALGEKLRENPRTILLSIPVLGYGIIYFTFLRNKESLAGAYGHLGLTFRLLYKHQWKNKRLLKIAYYLLSISSKIGTGTGQPTVRVIMGSVALEMENNTLAMEDYKSALKLAMKIGDKNQEAYILGHLGKLKTKLGEMESAYRDLTKGYKILLQAIKKDPSSMYLQIWISNLEIAISEWYLARGDKTQANIWAEKLSKRVDKNDLKTRMLDRDNLIRKISMGAIVLVATKIRFLIGYSGI